MKPLASLPHFVAALLFAPTICPAQESPTIGEQRSATGIRHPAFLSHRGEPHGHVGEANELVWEAKGRSRDGYVLENGNILYSQGNQAVEVTREGEVVWEYFHPTIRAHEVHVLTTNGEPLGRPLK